MKFFPIAFGEKEIRKFYETYMPVCSSLYKPNQSFELYNNLNIAYFKNVLKKPLALMNFQTAMI